MTLEVLAAPGAGGTEHLVHTGKEVFTEQAASRLSWMCRVALIEEEEVKAFRARGTAQAKTSRLKSARKQQLTPSGWS